MIICSLLKKNVHKSINIEAFAQVKILLPDANRSDLSLRLQGIKSLHSTRTCNGIVVL